MNKSIKELKQVKLDGGTTSLNNKQLATSLKGKYTKRHGKNKDHLKSLHGINKQTEGTTKMEQRVMP